MTLTRSPLSSFTSPTMTSTRRSRKIEEALPPTAILEVVILASGYTVVPTEAGMPATTESVLQAVLAAFNADKGKYSKDGRKPAPQHSKPRRAYMVLAVAHLHGGVQQGKPCYSEWTSASRQDRRTAVATSVEPQPKCQEQQPHNGRHVNTNGSRMIAKQYPTPTYTTYGSCTSQSRGGPKSVGLVPRPKDQPLVIGEVKVFRAPHEGRTAA